MLRRVAMHCYAPCKVGHGISVWAGLANKKSQWLARAQTPQVVRVQRCTHLLLSPGTAARYTRKTDS